jgi:hypothetical protein
MEDNQNAESFSQSVNDLYAGRTEMSKPTSLAINGDLPNPLLVQQTITGAQPGILPSQRPPGTPKTYDPEAQLQANREYFRASVRNTEDKNEWSKIYQYNSGPKGTYAERYRNFNEYGKLEFHPSFGDTEWKLNQTTGFLGDMWRTTTGALLPLAWNGVKSVFGSSSRILMDGDFFGEDSETAREYANISAKYYSSKDNIGSFVNNLTMNLGYTVGIMSTAMAENWAGAALGAFTGLKNITPKAAKLAFKEYQAGKSFDGIRTYAEMLDELKDINKVRQKWEQAQGIGKLQKVLQSDAGRVLNPFSNITDTFYSIRNNADDFAGYLGTSKKMFMTAGAAYRDFRNVNLALSESRLEAGMVYNNLIDDLYNEFVTKTGRTPNDEEMQNIISQSKKAAYETSVMNAGLIFFTNKISFDNILNPRIGSQGFLKQKIIDWKAVGGSKRYGDLGNIVFDVAKNEWKFAERGFKTWWNGWKTDPFHKSVYNTVGYFKRNFLEGTQESLQETISYANENYYKDTFQTYPVRKNIISKAIFGKGTTPMSYYGKGLNEQFSGTGLATFASGFAMGSLAGGLNSSMTYLYENANRIFDPKGYEEYKTQKSAIINDLVGQMNTIGVEEIMNSKLFNAGAQSILTRVQDSGNKKEVMDAESEAIADHFMMLEDYGTLDMYLDAISSYPKMTDEEFKDAFPKLADQDIGKHKARIGEIVEKGKEIKKLLDTYNKLFPNPIDLKKYSKDDPFYDEAYLMHKTWKDNIKSAVFYNETFHNVRERMVGIMNKSYEERPLQSMTKRQSDLILRPEEMYNEIGLLKNEANNLIAVGDPESKKLAKEKLKQVEAYESYYNAYTEFSDYYGRDRYFARAKAQLQEQRAEGEVVTDEEVNKYLDNTFGERSEETESELLLNLEKEYNNLLKTISNKPADYLFTNNVDDAFELVLDFYKLNDESRSLVDVINQMNDPKGFFEIYQRNLDWMTGLWDKKGELFTELAKQELSEIEDSGLLNFLAAQGIFMETSDFIEWRDNGVPPKEFYDEKKGLVVPEGSMAYDRYFGKLLMYKNLKNIEGLAKEEVEEAQINEEIDSLIEKKKKELEKLEAEFEENLLVETGKTKEQWDEEVPEKPTGRTKEVIEEEIKGLKAELNDLEEITTYAELEQKYNAYAQQNKFTTEEYLAAQDELTKDKALAKKARAFIKKLMDEGIEQNAAIQAAGIKFAVPILFSRQVIALQNETPVEPGDIVPPIENTKSWQDYQNRIKQTEERYEKLIELAKAKKTVKPSESKPAGKTSKDIVDESSTWDELPEELRLDLEAQFELYLTTSPENDGLGKPANYKQINPFDYEKIRNNWLDLNKNKITEYNNRPLDLESALPNLKYITFTKPITSYSITEIKNAKAALELFLSTNIGKDNKALTGATKNTIRNDIKELDKYLTYLRASFVPKNKAHLNFTIFSEMVADKQTGYVERVLDEETGQTTGYRFPGQEDAPERVTRVTADIKSDMTGKPKFPGYDPVREVYTNKKGEEAGGSMLRLFDSIMDNEDIKDENKAQMFMNSLKAAIYADKGSYPILKSERKLKIIQTALEQNFTKQTLKDIVNTVAYSESTIAGNTVDDMSRVAFTTDPTGGFVKPIKPKGMSDQAYENLFGKNGIITGLQDKVIDGTWRILSSDVIIYDKRLRESGLVGAMDLIAFNEKTGDLLIIDVKTSKAWKNFNDENNDYSKKLDYRIQLSIYKTLLYNMTGIEAKNIYILPVEITTDLEGNISSAVSKAAAVNADLIRNLKGQKALLEKDPAKNKTDIANLAERIKNLENGVTSPLEPIDPKVLEKYDIRMIAPELPPHLQSKPKDEGGSKPPMSEKDKEKKIKKLKKDIATLEKKIADFGPNPIQFVNNMPVENVEFKKLNDKLASLKQELGTLEKAAEESEFDLSDEIDSLLKGLGTDFFEDVEAFSDEDFKDLVNKINEATTLGELKTLKFDALSMLIEEPEKGPQLIDIIDKAIQARTLALNLSVEPNALAVGDVLISKTAIFGTKDNEPVRVAEINEDKIVVKQIVDRAKGKAARQKTFTVSQINSNFIKNTQEAIDNQSDNVVLTTEDEDASDLAQASVDSFVQNADLVNAAKESAEGQDTKSLLQNLKNIANKNNINNCNE